MMSQGREAEKKQAGMTWAESFRDILVTSMNKGQLPVLGAFGVISLMIWRMPSEDVSALAQQIVAGLRDYSLTGYAGMTVSVGAWYVHTKALRRSFIDEFDRIGREKTRIQSEAAGTRLSGSQSLRKGKK